MVEGIYLITFRGLSDWGMGMLILDKQTVTGADVGGALYDGKYNVSSENLHLDMELTVPPGVVLVQGVGPWSIPQKFPFAADIPLHALTDSSPVRVDLPPGPVNVILKRLRQVGA